MPLEALLIVLAVIIAVMVVLPAGRRLLATLIDVVDASVAMFAIRRTLRLDTTTSRQRRIDRRHAREQAEIVRRIGATGTAPVAPPVAIPVAPNRLVVSGETPAVAPTAARLPGPARRGSMVWDGVVGALALGIVLIAVSIVVNQPTGGVLGATATPRERIGVNRASGSPATRPASPAPTATGQGAPAASAIASAPTLAATAPAPIDPAAPQVDGLRTRLAGRTGGGPTVAVTLSWELAPGSAPAIGFRVAQRVDDRGFERVASVDGDARSLPMTLGVGRTSTFRIEPIGVGGVVGPPMEWAPVTPGRHQESSRLVSASGSWRDAAGPSLSGGGVTFSRTRGAKVTFDFRGTDIGWVATLTPMSGRAQVRVDGKLVDTVDLGAETVSYRQLVFRRHMTGGGAHTLEIRAVGGGRVDVDAFVVLR
jgi:hypothetical protein